jgi:hypothetical protein
LRAWCGKDENVKAGQGELLKRAKVFFYVLPVKQQNLTRTDKLSTCKRLLVDLELSYSIFIYRFIRANLVKCSIRLLDQLDVPAFANSSTSNDGFGFEFIFTFNRPTAWPQPESTWPVAFRAWQLAKATLSKLTVIKTVT